VAAGTISDGIRLLGAEPTAAEATTTMLKPSSAAELLNPDTVITGFFTSKELLAAGSSKPKHCRIKWWPEERNGDKLLASSIPFDDFAVISNAGTSDFGSVGDFAFVEKRLDGSTGYSAAKGYLIIATVPRIMFGRRIGVATEVVSSEAMVIGAQPPPARPLCRCTRRTTSCIAMYIGAPLILLSY
jgi:hypothetical protein